MKTSRKIVFLAIGLIIVSTTIGITLDRVNDAEPQQLTKEAPILSVSTTKMLPTTIEEKIFASGDVMPWQEAIIGTEVGGLKLAEVNVNVGEHVEKGQLIASFSTDTLQAELEKNNAEVQEAKATLEEANADKVRAVSLEAYNALSKQSIQRYMSAEKIAEARLNAAIAVQKLNQLRIKQASIVAPDHGVISSRSATLGGVLGIGDELFRLLRGGIIEWRAEVSASDLEKIETGQTAIIYNDEHKEIVGKVRKISPVVNTQTRNGLVYVDINQKSSLRSGMFAQGYFAISQSQVLTLPLSAIQIIDGFNYVMRVDRDSRIHRTKVSIGKRNNELVEIISGLNVEDEIVITGGSFIGDGDLVRVIPLSQSSNKGVAHEH